MAVGIGREVYEAELERIAGKGHVLLVESYEELTTKLKKLEKLACSKFAL